MICINMYHTYESLLVLLSLADLTRAFSPGHLALPNSGARRAEFERQVLCFSVWSGKKTLKNCQNAIQNLRACPTIPMARNYGNKLWLCRSRPGNPIVESWGKGSIGLQCPHLNDLNVVRYNSNQLNLEIQWNIMKFTKKHEVGIPNDSTRTAFS